jgi:hypothetical protein
MSVQIGELEEEPAHVVLRFRVGFEGEEAARGSVISIPGYIICALGALLEDMQASLSWIKTPGRSRTVGAQTFLYLRVHYPLEKSPYERIKLDVSPPP